MTLGNEEAEINDVSYSVMLDKKYVHKNIQPLKYTLPRKIHTWIEDENVKKCFNCGKDFSFFLRKHHCRLCGRIFCYDCTKFRDVIPENLLSDEAKKSSWNDYFKSYVKTIDLTRHRVCVFCHELIEKINLVKKLIEVFGIIKFDLKDLKKTGKICQLWNYATNYYLSIFREIQYKLPTNDYTDIEKNLLWINTEYIIGHNKYLIHLLKICDTDDQLIKVISLLNKRKSINCWTLMCTRNCRSDLTSFDCFNLLAHFFKYKKNFNNLEKFALKNLICADKEFKIYLPFLVYNLQFDEGILSTYLINKCSKNYDLFNSLYWELQLYSTSEKHKMMLIQIRNICAESKHESKFMKLMQGISFVNIINNINIDICEKNQSYNEIKDKYILENELSLPLDSTKKIKHIFVNKIKVKNSATKPLIVPCLLDNNNIYKVMYKTEDIRPDRIMLNIINLMEIILKKDEDLDINIVPYNILPIDCKSGLVEIVDNCQTMYYIKEKLKTSVLNYILENNGNIKIKDIRERFIKSTAAYSVITYLLGVGDRHLENIMITNDGRLFHIDYGYILGKDPVFNNPGIRITPEIVDAIGGFNSNYYISFKEMCTKIYNCLRRNIDIFMNFLLLIPKVTSNEITEDEIKQLIMKRFIPGESEIDAEIHLVNQLEKQYYTDTIKDWCHTQSKERTFTGTIITSVWNQNNRNMVKKEFKD